EVRRGGKGARRAAVPALQVDPLGAHDVHQRVANRVEAGAAAGEQLLARQPGARVEDALVRPVVVAVQRSDHLAEHGLNRGAPRVSRGAWECEASGRSTAEASL